MMGEEYGYKRSGKKCKEKFDNLYKYYKKTKEGKTGRHDGKHYRFFRQLEAIYGEQSNNNNNNEDPLSSSNFYTISTAATAAAEPNISITSSDFETSSSGNYHDDDLSAIAFMMSQKAGARENDDMSSKGRRSWREEVEKMVDLRMSKLMEVQENWMEKIMASVEDGEKERIFKEEQWRKKEMEKFDHEMNLFCARERNRVEAREVAFMEIIKRFSAKGYD